VYDVPAAAGGDAGLEGFSAVTESGRAGRVAAVNRRPDGLVLVIDTGDAYRAVPAHSVARIETRGRAVVLTDVGAEALAAAPAVEARVRRADSPALVRHIPRALDRLVIEGEPAAAQARARPWLAGAALTIAGIVVAFVGAPITAEAPGGPLRWLWLLVPAAAVAVGVTLLWRAIGSEDYRPLTAGEKAADVMTFLFGVSPRTRRRG
jgi:hypothetical protein